MNAAIRSAFLVAFSAVISSAAGNNAWAQGRSGQNAAPTVVVQNGYWKAELTTDRPQYTGKGAAIISLTLTNTSNLRHIVNTKTPVYDIVIREARTNKTVWTTAHSRTVPSGSLDLAAGASQKYREIWDRTTDAGTPVAGGVYTIEARVGPTQPSFLQIYVAPGRGGRDDDSGNNGGGGIEQPIPILPPGKGRIPQPPMNNPGPDTNSPLRGVLQASLTKAAPGSHVIFSYSVQNPTAAPVMVRFSSGQQYDMVVAAANGTPVWRASAGKMYMMSLGALSIGAGEIKQFRETWTIPATTAPGTYRVTAFLTAMGGGANMGLAAASVTVTASGR